MSSRTHATDRTEQRGSNAAPIRQPSATPGFIAFPILSFAAAAVVAWIGTAVSLRQGSRKAPALVAVTTLGTAALAVAGANRVFHGLLDARVLGLLVPLLSVSPATMAATFGTFGTSVTLRPRADRPSPPPTTRAPAGRRP
ncbi:hypothetical protein [Kitasatospora sp. NPDC017646]|uniref:hypothetical protein n=1 Tax=Kitasatospora sp. NPDC017646 TaxID=3364024 RepID=UPI0037953E0A